MAIFTKIYVAITPEKEEQLALSRAVLLANKYNAELVLGTSMYNGSIEKALTSKNQSALDLKNDFINHQKKVLEDLAANIDIKSKITCAVTWNKTWFKGIIELATDNNCDLIVKDTKNARYESTMRNLFTPDHWNLLRYSPVDVLMVKNYAWTDSGNIVAAISFDDDQTKDEYLGKIIAKKAGSMRDVFAAKLHFVNTISKAPTHTIVEKSIFNTESFNINTILKRKQKLLELANSVDTRDFAIFIEEGLPGKVVPNVCRALNADLLILGSAGRKGVDAILLGNTAEYIIDKIGCDTLVVKR